MSLQHIQKNSPGLLPKPAKFEKNPPNGYRVIRKTKCGAGGAAGAGGAGSSPIHKQASLAGRLMKFSWCNSFQVRIDLLNSENLKVAFAHLCNELQVCNFTMLYLTQKEVNNTFK